jgi:hypothetical protein
LRRAGPAAILRAVVCRPGIVCALLVLGCGAEPRPVLLSDRDGYTGRIRIEVGSAQRALEGELEYRREPGAVRFTQSVEGAAVVLERPDGGALRKTVDGREVELGLADEGDFALLWMVLSAEPEPGTRVEALAGGGYAIVAGGQRIAVHLQPSREG